ncbi:MAG: hypothetical protein JZU65_05180, partial [Chlorobium sp.]|nr:hypothetical protein [Chlorobium sp.]
MNQKTESAHITPRSIPLRFSMFCTKACSEHASTQFHFDGVIFAQAERRSDKPAGSAGLNGTFSQWLSVHYSSLITL